MFISEDGKDIYEGDTIYGISVDGWEIFSGRVEKGNCFHKETWVHGKFSSKEAAKSCVEENKPQFSKKQVINILKGFDRDVNCFDERFNYNIYIEKYKDEKEM